MIRALTTALSGMTAQQTGLAVRANNLANVTTVGFKASRTTFAEAPGGGVGIQATQPDLSQGAIYETGNPDDAALTGSGYFQVVAGNGQTSYTRAGAFARNAQGDLVTPDGRAAAPAGEGPSSVPVVQFANPGGLTNLGASQFAANATSGTAVAADPGQVETGALEMSNTDLADEVPGVSMALRAYQANIKSAQTADEMLKTVVNLRR